MIDFSRRACRALRAFTRYGACVLYSFLTCQRQRRAIMSVCCCRAPLSLMPCRERSAADASGTERAVRAVRDVTAFVLRERELCQIDTGAARAAP